MPARDNPLISKLLSFFSWVIGLFKYVTEWVWEIIYGWNPVSSSPHFKCCQHYCTAAKFTHKAESWQKQIRFSLLLHFCILSKCFSPLHRVGIQQPSVLHPSLLFSIAFKKTVSLFFIKAHTRGSGWMLFVKYRLWSLCNPRISSSGFLGPERLWCYCCCSVSLVQSVQHLQYLWRPSQTSICCSHCWIYSFWVGAVGAGGEFLSPLHLPPSFDKLHHVWVVEIRWREAGFWFHSGTIVPL